MVKSSDVILSLKLFGSRTSPSSKKKKSSLVTGRGRFLRKQLIHVEAQCDRILGNKSRSFPKRCQFYTNRHPSRTLRWSSDHLTTDPLRCHSFQSCRYRCVSASPPSSSQVWLRYHRRKSCCLSGANPKHGFGLPKVHQAHVVLSRHHRVERSTGSRSLRFLLAISPVLSGKYSLSPDCDSQSKVEQVPASEPPTFVYLHALR